MAGSAPSLRVRPDTAELGRVRARVGEWADAAGLPDGAGRRLQLAVDEAVANAIEHGMAEGARVVVRGAPARGRLSVTVRYRGDRFDPTSAPAPSTRDALRRHATHGYGLHLIRRLVDEIAYRWDGASNELEMTVRGR